MSSAAPLVTELLAAAPGLVALVTSRAALHLYGEHVRAVGPLPVPDPGSTDTGHAAVELFSLRARAVLRDFDPAESAQAVGEICRRLDGLPLAIELAAARVALLDPEAMLRRLRRLDLSEAGPRDRPLRHQGLRSTIAWSRDLLPPDARQLFPLLGVFAGGATAEAVEDVSGCRPETPATLVGSGLVQEHEVNGETRFTMLETVHEFALEELELAGCTDAARRRHADYYLRLVERAQPELAGREQRSWFARLGAELDNLRAAFRWLCDHAEGEPAARLGRRARRPAGDARPRPRGPGNLLHRARVGVNPGRHRKARVHVGPVGDQPGRPGHGHEALRDGRSDVPPSSAISSESPSCISSRAWTALCRDDQPTAGRLARESIDIARAAGAERVAAMSLMILGMAEAYDGSPRGREHLEEALVYGRAAGDEWLTGVVLVNFCATAIVGGDPDATIELSREAIELGRELGDPATEASAMANLGIGQLLRGELTAAEETTVEALGVAEALGRQYLVWAILHTLACIAAADGNDDRAARLAGAAAPLGLEAGGLVLLPERVIEERFLVPAQERLGERSWLELYQSGESMDLEDTLRYAREQRPVVEQALADGGR